MPAQPRNRGHRFAAYPRCSADTRGRGLLMSEEPEKEADDLEPVTELRDGVRADLCRMALEAAGIQAWLSTRNLASVAPDLGIAIGVRVLVRSSELAAAREVLTDLDGGSASLPEEAEACPRCGSAEAGRVGKPARIRALVNHVVFGIPRPDVRWVWRCEKCGHEWR
jgi:hypothetical protein